MVITHDGTEYELSMTRKGASVAEENGLSASEISEKPFTALYLLFFAALYGKYRLSPAKSNAILDDVLDAGDFEFAEIFEELAGQYGNLFGSVGSEKKAKK